MVKAAHSQQLQQLFETHLEETEAQIERLEECFGILGIQPRAKACKGMMGIVERARRSWPKGRRKMNTGQALECERIHAPMTRVRPAIVGTWRRRLFFLCMRYGAVRTIERY